MSLIDDLLRRKADLSPAQRALLEKWKRGDSAPAREPDAIAPRPADVAPPLSFAQQRLWFLDQLAPDNAAYIIPIAMRLSGTLDVAALQHALDAIVARHEILRTTFVSTADQPVQRIAASTGLPMDRVDLTGEANPAAAAEQVLSAEAQRPFDLARGPLIRATLMQLGPEEYIALLTMHHIVSDGWSKGVLIHELAVLYVAFAQNRPVALPPLPIQYADYAAWQRGWLQGAALEAQAAYWRAQLAGLPALDLPGDYPRPPVQTFRGAQHMLALPPTLGQLLVELSQRHGATLFMTLLAAFGVLLARYSGQTDIAIGSPVAGRTRPETQQLVGPFINTLVLRADLQGNPSFGELLERVRAVCAGAYAHQDLPFEKLVDLLHPNRDLSRNPLFHVMLNVQNAPLPDQELAGLTLHPLDIQTGAAQLDLSLFLVHTEAGLVGSLEYNTDLFAPPTIARLAEHLRTLLEGIVADPSQRIAELPLLAAAERQQVLVAWNRTDANYPADACIHQLFDAQAARTPDAPALVFGREQLTYAELDARASRLAHHLHALGVGPDTLVGLCVERSVNLVVGVLAILKAGGAYLPLDPTYPAERLALMLKDSRAPVVLTQRHQSATMPADLLESLEVVYLDSDWPGDANERADLDSGVGATNLAYVIYTSGSTGRPKGVMISHRNAVNFFVGMDQRIGTEPGAWLAVTSVSFDISVLELLWTLTRGFKVVVRADQRQAVRAATQAAIRPLAFSLFYFAGDAGEHAGDRYRLLLEGARFADRAGFSAVWTPERHFHPFGGLYPNPSVVSAAIAAVTERVQIRAGSVVLPLHQPIRVAEEWSVVDNLSNGRVGLSFASGWHADDFVLAPDNYDGRKTFMLEGIDTIRSLWRGEPVSARGGAGNQVAVSIFPPPIRRELPIWLTAAGNPETFRMAGEAGVGLLTHLLGQSLDELADKIAVYRQAWRDGGHGPGDGHVTLMLHTFVGEDLDAVRETARQPFYAYLRSSLDLIGNLARSIGQDIAAATFTEADMEALLAYAFDRYFTGSSLMGTPETCLHMVERVKAIGVDEVACLIDFGIATDTVLASLESLDAVRARSQPPAAPPAEILSLPDELALHAVSHMQCTPSLARILAQEPQNLAAMRSLRTLLLGGEALPPDLVTQLAAELPATIINMYGPTETTIWSSTHLVDRAAEAASIGRPIANTQIYLLDRAYNPVPVGVPGELYIGGAGVARGYLDRPDLTAERFVPNPFVAGDDLDALALHRSDRLYRTGDLARYRADGTIEFLGRIDQQVKLRGYRIELGEIETALRQHTDIDDAVVVLREDAPGDKRLAAYVVRRANANGQTVDHDGQTLIAALRALLHDTLPEYMQPAVYMLLDVLPLTPNRKIDRRALPDPGRVRSTQHTYVAPRTPSERALADLWADVLRVERVGIHDNFFELGGDSILSLQVISRASGVGLRLTLTQLFQHQTIAALMASAPVTPVVAADQGALVGPVPLLPFQHWLLEQNLSDMHHWNQTVLFAVAQPPTPALLHEVVRLLMLHHDALRARFTRTADGWQQQIAAPDVLVPFTWIDLSGAPEDARIAMFEARAAAMQGSLNLADGPLLRVAYADFGAHQPGRLIIIMHHLVTDGVSWRVILDDLQTAYRQLSRGEAVQLPPKTTSIKQWAAWLADYARGAALQERGYWLDPAYAQTGQLPVDHPQGLRTSTVASSYTHRTWLDAELTRALLQEVPAVHQVQINDILLCALAWACRSWTGAPHVLMEIEGHGREELFGDADVSRTVGWLASLFPIVLDVSGAASPVAALGAVKTQLGRIPQRGIGYGLLRYMGGDEELATQLRALPQAEIRFNYLGQFDQVLAEDAPFAPAREAVGDVRSPRGERRYLLEVDGSIVGGRLQIGWTYSRELHHDATILRLADQFVGALRALAASCAR